MNNAIVTRSISKRYGNHIAVEDVSLQVNSGEIYGFLGLNGAGKTTTIRMLLGMLRPTAGSAQILGIRVHPGGVDLWSRVGYMVETPHAYPELSVRENLEVIRRLRDVKDPRAVDRILERLSLEPYASRRTDTMSLENAQRLGLAKALLHEPALLILDEPANGLDPAGVVEVRHLLLSLVREQGVTVFMSSHVLSEVSRLATHIGIIHGGRLVEELPALELERRRGRWLVVDARDRQAARATLMRVGYAMSSCEDGVLKVTDERAVASPEEVARQLVREDVPPTRLTVEQEDLETHFLQLVGVER